MTTLIVGASGATGRLLVEQLLNQEELVRIIVRNQTNLPNDLHDHKNLTITRASILDLSDAELEAQIKDCNAVASCLGHTLNFKGIFGKPRRLVTDATQRLCKAIKANNQDSPTKFLLMNTTGNSNRDLDEKISFAQQCVIGLLRVLLPPHVDNEQAADFLRTTITKNNKHIEWAAIRPDGLIDETKVSEYETYESPIRSAIFDAGKTSRINVANFMANLIMDDQLWSQWKGQMPVIYNKVQ